MQRLFSMFPVGAPGAALFALRVCVAATLIADETAHWTLVTPWMLFPAALTAICLCLGLLTPYCAAFCCLMELFARITAGEQDIFHLAISILTSAVLAVLGPGAYSLDARIFGRRLLTVPSRHRPPSD